ncbi:S58 family peptidase [Roseovarius faecimaris]|uniref:S58 family peptidase n=1 Tax=Roseovarius faecimaris TaxID=2494550 RepID=A0A6I6IWY5_9RHOB|nr:P1 family peptidase [Roseovarius faecimaris]QGX99986.1 S58 family peptidase [Roseovarius faecimaris]
MTKPRARDLGIPFDGTPGTFNAITDIPGVELGQTTLTAGPVRTGVTALLPRGKRRDPSPVWAGHFNLNGNGEMTGTHWINEAGYFLGPVCLTNTHSVGMVHHAATGWMTDTYADHFQGDHGWAMPVVAETYDGFANDIVGRHVTEAHARAALDTAAPGPVAEGNTGGGTGMMTYEFKGGTGTSSRRVTLGTQGFTVAALVQSNFGTRRELMVRGVPVGRLWPEDAPLSGMGGRDTGSIIVIIGTDIPLLPGQLRRLAKRGALGIGRTGTSGGHYSGDIMLAFSTANDLPLPRMTADEHPLFNSMTCLGEHYLDTVYAAAVDAVEEAVLNALIAAETMPLIKPQGSSWQAMDHARLRQIMADHGRLN